MRYITLFIILEQSDIEPNNSLEEWFKPSN